MRLLIVGLALLGACGGDRCERVEDRAVEAVLEVFDADQSCTTDDDCVVVPVNGSCFDTCTRVVATDNEAAVLAALDDIETDICGDYGDCVFIRPPCAAPEAPRCNDDGQCE